MVKTLKLLLVAGLIAVGAGPALAGPVAVDREDASAAVRIEVGESPVPDLSAPDSLIGSTFPDQIPDTRSARRIDRERPSRDSPYREAEPPPVAERPGWASPDPLASTIRGLVNVSPGQSPSPGGTAARKQPENSAPGEAPVLSDDPELQARIAAVREGAADAVKWALSPEMGDDGRVRFSVMGVSGFHLDQKNGEVTAGFRNYGVNPVVKSGESGYGQGPGYGERRDARGGWSDESERNVIYKIAFTVWDVITHPLSLAFLIIFIFIRVGLSLAKVNQTY
jgi:hypothetical protein